MLQLQKSYQLLINTFMNDTLKQTSINCHILNNDLDLVLDCIKQKLQISKIQILQKLIVDTSYKSLHLCIDLLHIYMHQYNFSQNYFNLFLVFKNLNRFSNKYVQLVFNTYVISFNYIIQNNLVWNNVVKYSLIRINNTDNFLFNLKLIFVAIQKLYKCTNNSNRIFIHVAEFLFLLRKFYLIDFNLNIKDQKFFFNIIVNIVIESYLAHLKRKNELNDPDIMANINWIVLFDIILSNWNLLYDRYKYFFKQNGKKIINELYQNKTYLKKYFWYIKDKDIIIQLLEQI